MSDPSLEVYPVEVRLSNKKDAVSSSVLGQTNIDVRTCARGYILFRLVHPSDPRVAMSRPTAAVDQEISSELISAIKTKKKV